MDRTVNHVTMPVKLKSFNLYDFIKYLGLWWYVCVICQRCIKIMYDINL